MILKFLRLFPQFRDLESSVASLRELQVFGEQRVLRSQREAYLFRFENECLKLEVSKLTGKRDARGKFTKKYL